MFLTPVHAFLVRNQRCGTGYFKGGKHKDGLLECPMETCDLEFKVKPISLIAQLSLEKFSCWSIGLEKEEKGRFRQNRGGPGESNKGETQHKI